MWNKVKKVAGYAWSAPVTVVGLVYTSIFQLIGWHDWIGVRDDALVWRVSSSVPQWLGTLWKPWSGHTIGNVVVLNVDPEEQPKVLLHEMVHVRQCMRLGVFQPLIYGLAYLGIKFGCEASDPYFTNPFEVDARRAVGQVIDVEGALKRIRNAKKKVDPS